MILILILFIPDLTLFLKSNVAKRKVWPTSLSSVQTALHVSISSKHQLQFAKKKERKKLKYTYSNF